jgi:hypothetical protein
VVVVILCGAAVCNDLAKSIGGPLLMNNFTELAQKLSDNLLLMDLYSYMKENIYFLETQNLSRGTCPHSLCTV